MGPSVPVAYLARVAASCSACQIIFLTSTSTQWLM